MNLEAIKNREILATQGPWKIVKSEETGVQIGTTWEHGQLEDCVPVVTTAHGVSGTTIYINDNNAEFIAHARQDVPALIAEIERLQNELAKTQRLLDVTELAEAKGRMAVERLKEALEKVQRECLEAKDNYVEESVIDSILEIISVAGESDE